jgi:surface antigen
VHHAPLFVAAEIDGHHRRCSLHAIRVAQTSDQIGMSAMRLARRLAVSCVLAASMSLVSGQAAAQFGGFSLPSIPQAPRVQAEGCPKGKTRDAGSAMLGDFLGKRINRAASEAGVTRFIPSAEFADTLTKAIACRLDPDEQKQAAEATVQATRGGEVGSTAAWTSGTRDNVSGTSTVTARSTDVASAAGGPRQCITVTDVIIVNGEETTANKRMCRAPGAARYTLAA